MTFSIKNGIKLTWYHFHECDMLISYLLFVGIGFINVPQSGWVFAISWVIMVTAIFIFVRCFEDPKELGYDKDGNR